MDFLRFLQAVFTGLTNGAVYGIVGIGFVVIHRITGVINFAQGDLALVGGFAAVAFAGVAPLWIAIPLGMLVAAAVATLLYGGAVRPLRRAGLLVQTIVTLGGAIVVRSALQLIFGTRPYQIEPFMSGPAVRVAGASFPRQALWIVLIAFILVVALSWFFERTLLGRAVTACADNRYAAGVVGINADLMAAISWAVSGAIAGAIIITHAPIGFVSVLGGLALSVKGFVAAILGGLERIWPTLIGGVLLGILESTTTLFISSRHQNIIALGLLLVLLLVRPSGLTRARVTERV